ncbi:MAG TPA: PIN-like domain-containing protein [Flavobacterium sp.]|jgi:hypothetical protein
MDKNNFDSFRIDDDNEKILFEDALIFFDTSALLNFYYFSEDNRKEIVEKLFSQWKKRLWITSQSEYEFLKNRSKVIHKPLDTYNTLLTKSKGQKEGGHIEEINQLINQIKPIVSTELRGHLKTLQEKTSKTNKHPFLDGFSFEKINTETHNLEIAIESYNKNFLAFRDQLVENISQQKKKLKSVITNDSVLKIFEMFFNVTEKFTYDQISEIVKEGEIRYRNQIPPGYFDEEEKLGFQKYGDLILWKQLLEKAVELNNDVILVINDAKEDWWVIDDKKKHISPRHELIMEFESTTNRKFWMYDINDFLYKSNNYISTAIDKETIENIKEIINVEDSEERYKIIDWLLEYFPDVLEIEHFDLDNNLNYDHIMRDENHNTYCVTHKMVNSPVYTKLMFKIRDYILNFIKLPLSHKEYILILEYPNYETANTFFTHSSSKKTLRTLVKKFIGKIRLILVFRKNEKLELLFDSTMNVS